MAIYTLQPGQPQQIVYAASRNRTPPITEYVITNLDQQDPCYIGAADAADQQPDLTADMTRDILAPLQSVTVRATLDWWALTTSTNPAQLDVIPEGISESTSPLDSAQAFILAGVPLLIAQEIATSGIGFNLVAAPQLLYNVIAPPGPPGTGGPWGASVYGGTGGDQGTTQEFQTLTGRPVKAKRVYFSGQPNTGKVFTSTAQFPGDLAAAFNLGLIAVISFKPTFSGFISGLPGTLPTPQQLQTDQTAMVNCLNSIIALGFPAANLRVTMQHEPENPSKNITPAQYLNLYNGVASGGLTNYAALHAICPVYHIALADEVTGTLNKQYLPFTPTLGANFVDGFLADYYGNNMFPASGQPKLLPQYAAMADNAVPALPFGIGEMGSTTSGTNLTNAQNALWLLAKSITISGTTYPGDPVNSVEAVMSARLNAGKTNLETMWFANYGGPGPNAITAPTDPRIPMLQRLHDTLAGSGLATAANVAAGTTVVFQPLIPSTNAGYAIANGISYDITINLTAAAAGSTRPFTTIKLQWFNSDDPNATPVDTELWALPTGANGTTGTVITGRGPQRGQFFSVSVHNRDTVGVACALQINQTSRATDRDDWRWDAINSVAVPGFNLPSGGIFSLSLGSMSTVNVPATSSISRLISLYAGQVYYRWDTSAGANQMSMTMAPQPSQVFGNGFEVNDSQPSNRIVAFPRGPQLVTFTNTDVAAHTVNLEVITIET